MPEELETVYRLIYWIDVEQFEKDFDELWKVDRFLINSRADRWYVKTFKRKILS